MEPTGKEFERIHTDPELRPEAAGESTETPQSPERLAEREQTLRSFEYEGVGPMVPESAEGIPVRTVAAQGVQKGEVLDEVERIMEDGLDELYTALSPEKQEEFKTKGEETARKIETLLLQVKVRVKKIVVLLRSWLHIIPGVNSFFLDQEAKIKADRLIRIRKTSSNDHNKL